VRIKFLSELLRWLVMGHEGSIRAENERLGAAEKSFDLQLSGKNPRLTTNIVDAVLTGAMPCDERELTAIFSANFRKSSSILASTMRFALRRIVSKTGSLRMSASSLSHPRGRSDPPRHPHVGQGRMPIA
jgi:hypothetical protein